MNRHFEILALITSFIILLCGCDGKDPSSPSSQNFSEVVERSFAAGDSCTLTVENFAGGVNVHTGEAGTIRVIATKWASREEHLEQIEVEMAEEDSGLHVITDNPSNLGNVSVDLDISAPPGALMNLSNGAGGIDYQGRPHGSNSFNVAVGTIKLRMPEDINVTVNLVTSVGAIFLDFTVDGQVSDKVVSGTIGTGDEGEVHAHTAVGNIHLIRQ
jgi:hypothetical protein